MSVPGDFNSYDFEILSNISQSLHDIYFSSDPSTIDIKVENLVLQTLRSATKAGMLPGQLTDEMEKQIKNLKDRSIRSLSHDELHNLQSTLNLKPERADPGKTNLGVSSSKHDKANQTNSWIKAIFPTHNLFLPNFFHLETQAPILSKQESDLLLKVLKQNGFSSIEAYNDLLKAAKKACPSSYNFTEEQLKIIKATLQPDRLRSSLIHGDSGYPVQFQKDNIDAQRSTWLSVNIQGKSYPLNSKENIDLCISQLTTAAKNISPEHAEKLRDCFLLLASQTLPNCMQKGKNDLAISIQNNTTADVKGSLLPSSVSIQAIEGSEDGCKFTCNLSFNFSYNLTINASDEDSTALKTILKKIGLDQIFSGNIKASFDANLDYSTSELTIIPAKPTVTIVK